MKGDKTNDYVINMIRILEKRYMVTGELAEMIDIPIMIKTKAVILNWVKEHWRTTEQQNEATAVYI